MFKRAIILLNIFIAKYYFVVEESNFNPSQTYRFSTYAPAEGGATPLTVWPLIELELRGKSKRAGRYETQQLIPKFKVSGQLVTSQVRSMTPMLGFGF